MSDLKAQSSSFGRGWITTNALASGISRLVTSPFKRHGAPTYFRDVMYSLLRTQLGMQSMADFRYADAPNSKTYADVCKVRNLTPDIEKLSNGQEAHWFGPRDAKHVLVWFHGGGYCVTANIGVFHWTAHLTQTLQSLGHSFATVLPTYPLAPESPYPAQLVAGATFLNHFFEAAPSRSPSDVILGGDSAGGNLCIALLSHALHPHPDASVPPPQGWASGTPFRSTLLLSPWTSFDSDANATPSFRSNAQMDVLTDKLVDMWASSFLGGKKPPVGDEYAEPRRAKAEWWEGADAVLGDVLVYGGGGEVLIDAIKGWAWDFAEGYHRGAGASGRKGRVELAVVAKEMHEEPILDYLIGFKDEKRGEGAKAIESWMMSKL